MSKESFVFEVNQKSFEKYVLLNSYKIPVFVEFMGVWSGPCVTMDILFTGLAKEFAGEFIFAKVDTDEQPGLLKEYKIHNLPSLLIFKDGKLVRTEEGELKENEARELLKDFSIENESDVMREQAREKHLSGNTEAAIIQLTEAIKKDPSNTRVVMDMVQIFIDIGELEQASGLYARLPEAARETEMGKALRGELTFVTLAAKTKGVEVLKQKVMTNPDDYDARFDLAICQIAQYDNDAAMTNLLYIQENNVSYKDGAVKELIITVANMIAPVDHDSAQEIRRKLANLVAR